jgi:hypothetical protein
VSEVGKNQRLHGILGGAIVGMVVAIPSYIAAIIYGWSPSPALVLVACGVGGACFGIVFPRLMDGICSVLTHFF